MSDLIDKYMGKPELDEGLGDGVIKTLKKRAKDVIDNLKYMMDITKKLGKYGFKELQS